MDKLDKTIEELQKGKKKKVIEKITTPIIKEEIILNNIPVVKDEPIDIGEIFKEHPEIIRDEIDREIVEKIEDYVKNQQLQEEIRQVGVIDTYLPFVLTKLGICGINAEARKLIANGKVKVNNNVVNLMYSTKELSNFLLEVNGVKYEIFKVD